MTDTSPTTSGAIQEQGVDAMTVFVWGSGDFAENLFGGPGFRSRAEAARAWEIYRRRVWARTHRFRLPEPATEFDGLTIDSLDDVRSRWNHIAPFELEPSLALLEADRRHLETFAKTRGGKSISDYLDLLREDIDAIEATARSLAAFAGEYWERPYPHHLGSARCYGTTDPRPTANHDEGARTDGDN